MTKIIRLLLLVSGLFSTTLALGQEKVQMADTMRSNGKIYVVVAVCLTILIGLFLYVFSLDRKLTRFEKVNRKDSRLPV